MPLMMSDAAPLLPIVSVLVSGVPTGVEPTTNGDASKVSVDCVPEPFSVRVGEGSPARSLLSDTVSVSVNEPSADGSNVTGSVTDSVGPTGNVPVIAPRDQCVPVVST